MTRLSNIKPMGRFTYRVTGQSYNFKKGRNIQRGTDVIFYTYQGKRVYVSDLDFYTYKLYIPVAEYEEFIKSNKVENDFDKENYEFAKWVFEKEEGRKPNMNDTKDMNAVSLLEVGIKYSRNYGKK